MMTLTLSVVGLLVMAVAALSIPLGIPGLWIMLGVVALASLAGAVPASTLAGLLALGVLAEATEFMALHRLGRRYGGTNRAFLGALGGGILGAVVGAPLSLLGAVGLGLLGTFAGAAAVTAAETRSLRRAGTVGWGAVLGRALGTGLKLGAAGVTWVVTAWTLLSGPLGA